MRKLCICFITLFSLLSTNAQEVFTAEIENSEKVIGNKFVYFEDPTNKIGFKEILKRNDFKNIKSEIPNFNITASTIWAKIKLKCRQEADWYLVLDPAEYYEISYFIKRGKSDWKEIKTGNSFPNSTRIIAVNHFMVKLDLSMTDTTFIYFKVKDQIPISFEFKIGTLENFASLFHKNDLTNGLCYGIMIMMLIYNFYLFVTNKKWVYLYYVLFVLFNMLFTSILSGYGVHYPAWVIKTISFAPLIPATLLGMFSMLFMLELFKENLSDRFKKFVYLFMLSAVLDLILSTTPLVHLSQVFIQVLGLMLAVISITAAIIALRKKNSSAGYYLIGFGVYMSALIYIILASQGVFNIKGDQRQILIIGSMIESIMLSFALADKFKLAQKERLKAQEEGFIQAKENERLVREQNITLERKVLERTLELKAQKEIIEEKNEELVASINYAKRIQNALFTPEKFIEKTLNRLIGNKD